MMDGQMFFKTLMQSSSIAPIQFNGGDETNSFPVSGDEVNILASPGDHDVGSSKLKIKNIVNFGWEHKYYPGQLVAVHKSGTYVAYTITTPGKNLGVVRVVNRVTDDRILVKGMKGVVKDLAFAHTDSEVILGCVDTVGNLFVHRVTETSSGLANERLLEVTREVVEPEVEHRLIWCPYLPDVEDEDGDTSAARLLVLTHGSIAEIWSLDLVVEHHGPGPLAPADVTQGLLRIDGIGGCVTDASFSPDGSALATASADGQVKFFQVYLLEEGAPRCLHQWSPHGGRPVSSLFFLDDHPNYQPEVQVWKYAVTGCSKNSEVKVWSCVSWSCLQTVSLTRPNSDKPLRLKSALDPTASYLLLADIDHSLVYVLGLDQSGEQGARVVSVSEFATPAPFLSFSCVSAGRRLVEQTTEGEQVSQDEDSVPGTGAGKEKTVVQLYLVQPKSLQECSIIYEDAALVGDNLKGDQETSLSFQERSLSLSDNPVFSQSASEQSSSDSLSLVSPADLVPPQFPPMVKEELEVEDLQSSPVSHSSPRASLPTTTSGLPLPPLPTTSSGLPLPPLPTTSSGLPLPPLPTTSSGLPLPPVCLTSRSASNVEQLAEAASKISLLSPDQFKLGPSQLSSLGDPGVIKVESESSSTADSDLELGGQVPKLEKVEQEGVSGNSSPSREVADILAEERPVFQEQESPDRTFEEEDSASPSPNFSTTNVKLNLSSTVFPTPPAVPLTSSSGEAGDSSSTHHLEKMVLALHSQMQADRETHATALASLEEKIELLLGRGREDETLLGQRLEAGLRQQSLVTEQVRQEQEQAMVTSLSASVGGRLEHVVTGELKKNLPSIVTRALEGAKVGVENGVSSKLAGVELQMEQGIRDVVNRVVNNQQTRDTIAKAVAQSVTQSLQGAITESYKQAFQQQSVGFERALSHLLKQMSDQFLAGSREYEAALARRMEVQESKAGPQLQALQQVKEGLDRLSGEVAEISRREARPALSGEQVADIVRRELAAALDANRLSSVTPQPDLKAITVHQAIQAHIQAGRLNEAFQAALSAGDLQLVVFTCELLNTTQVFNSATCPLSQSVLLSLVQQLSVDLADRTEVKHAYLHEAIVNLDTEDPTTKAYIKSVLGQLHQSLIKYISANPNSKMTRNMKILAMAAESHLKV